MNAMKLCALCSLREHVANAIDDAMASAFVFGVFAPSFALTEDRETLIAGLCDLHGEAVVVTLGLFAEGTVPIDAPQVLCEAVARAQIMVKSSPRGNNVIRFAQDHVAEAETRQQRRARERREKRERR